MSLLELCAVVFTYNAMTLGNGPGMVPLLQADLVDRRDEPGSHRHESDAVPGVLHRPLGGPAGQIDKPAGSSAWS